MRDLEDHEGQPAVLKADAAGASRFELSVMLPILAAAAKSVPPGP